ncbi:MAG: AsmA-like C-terminal domain-containing protein [Pikeienuella sp.]
MKAETGENAPKRARRGVVARLTRLAVTVLSGLFLLAIVLSGGLYLRLAAGPVDLSPLIPLVEREASARIPGARLSLGDLRLELVSGERGRGAALTVRDAVLIDEETGPFARAPELSASFRAGDLLSGGFIPYDVRLTGLSGRLARDESGAFSFGFSGAGEDTGEGAAAFARLLEAATAGEPGAAAEENAESIEAVAAEMLDAAPPGRRRLRLRGASIVYLDRFSGREYRADGVNISFWSGRRGLAARAEVALDGGRHGRVSGVLRGRRTPDNRIALKVSFENAAPSDIGGQIVALDWLSAFDAPVGGEISLAMDMAGALSALEGRFTAGAGHVAFDEETVEPIESATLDFTYDPASERFQIGEVALKAPRVNFSGVGFVAVNRDEQAVPRDVVAQLDFDDIAVSAPEFFDAPLDYQSGRITGRVTLDPLLIEIGELRLNRERMRLALAGRLWPEGEGWRADMTADGGDVSLAELMGHWPRQAAPGAREWMLANMEAADIPEVDAIVRLGGAEEELKIDFSFRDTVGHPLRPMPPIRDGVGSGQVDLKRFSLSLEAGHVMTESGGALDLAGSRFVIADLDHPATPGTATIHAKGATAAALSLIDSAPLNLLSALGVPLGEVGGAAEVAATTTIPLLKDLLLADVEAEAEARFSDVSLVAPGLDREVRAKTLTLTANTAEFTLQGDAEVASIPASVIWREKFSPSSRSIAVRAVATPARLRAFGVEQAWFSAGRAPVSATLTFDAGAGMGFSVDAALERGAFAIPEIGWSKPEGAPGKLSAAGRISGERLTLERFSLEADDLIAAGSAATDAAGAPERVSLSDLRYRGAVDLALDARREGRLWRIDAHGPLLDLTRLDDLIGEAISDGMGETPERGAAVAPFRIDARIGELKVLEDRAFRDVEGFLRRTGRDEVIAAVDGRLNEGAPVSANLRRGPDGGRMRLRIEDAGRFLRDAGAFGDGAGGVLVLRAEIARGDPLRLSGQIDVSDIVIHEDAKLEQMLEGAALTDLRRKMRDDGMVFDSISAPFSYGEDVITLDDAVAKGPSIGINISGDYAIEADRVDMRGVFTPLYRINSALGGIPVVGKVLTGGDGQGLFAFTFAVKGPIGDPDVSVNPLSVLAPGILRRLFDGSAGEVSGATTSLEGLRQTTEP